MPTRAERKPVQVDCRRSSCRTTIAQVSAGVPTPASIATSRAPKRLVGRMSVIRARRVFLVLSAAFGVLGYARIREPILTWGATQAEAAGPLEGDELLPAADGATTRAIDIEAPPADVWPWLAQMGPAPRGGAYTYDWIENLLGLDMHSVDRVLPEYQHPQVGDTIELGSKPYAT